MKKAIQFGAGNIGRGFIGAVLHQAGYRVLFADVNQEVIDKINADKRYTVHVMDIECRAQVIDNISAMATSSEQLLEQICSADIITTAVGLSILPRIAPQIAKGITERCRAGVQSTLNIIACENGIRATSQLKGEVLNYLNETEKAYVQEWVGFADCSVDRIVPPVRSENFIDVVVEKFYEWNVERASLKGNLPMIEGMNLAENLSAYIERKLFTLNTGHAITAYLGYMKGYSTIDQSIDDDEIAKIVLGAMRESGMGLVKKFGFDRDAHFKYIDKIIDRFKNPYLKDDVGRVCRDPLRKLSPNDRLIKPMMTAMEYGIEPENLLVGIGAALGYNNPEDSQSDRLQHMIVREGLRKTIEQVAQIAPQSHVLDQIIEAYANLKTKTEIIWYPNRSLSVLQMACMPALQLN